MLIYTSLYHLIHMYMYYLPSGEPVAWCVSDREDMTVMNLFLSKLQESCSMAEVMLNG